MTLLFMDGFDMQDADKKYLSSLSLPPIYTDAPRYGVGGTYRQNGGTGNLIKDFTPSATVILGAAVCIQSFSSERLLFGVNGDAGVTPHINVRVSTSGFLVVYRNTTSIATSATPLALNDWNYIEMKVTLHDTTGSVIVRVNGTPYITFTGDTRNAGTSLNMDRFVVGTSAGNTGIVLDDFYLQNSLGSAPNNDFLGEIMVRTILPTGAGANTGFSPVGSANNWDNVNEVPVSIADYNASSVVGTKDTYVVENLPASTATVYGVQANVVAAKTSPGTGNAAVLVRSGGTDYRGSTVTLTPVAKTITAAHEVNPATGVAWTPTAVNDMELGFEVM